MPTYPDQISLPESPTPSGETSQQTLVFLQPLALAHTPPVQLNQCIRLWLVFDAASHTALGQLISGNPDIERVGSLYPLWAPLGRMPTRRHVFLSLSVACGVHRCHH